MSELDKLRINADSSQFFVVSNGRTLKNLFELTNALQSMDDETYYHHVNSERNDFSNWIRHVFSDDSLADDMTKAKDKEDMVKIINKRIKKLEKEKQKKEKAEKEAAETEQREKEKVKKEKEEKKRREEERKAEQKKKEERKAEKKKAEDQETKVEHIPEDDKNREILEKIDEILLKEKEIQKREEKILEVEERIEKQLEKNKRRKDTGDNSFFSMEFIQGIATGFLLALILGLIYLKFFM